MKKHKNIFISIGFYILTILFYFLLNSPLTFPFYIFGLIGIFFAHLSNRNKESAWVGYLLMIIGILLLLFPFYATPLAFMLSGTFFNLTH